MKHVSAAVVLWLAAGLCAAQTPPEWAYPVNPPGFKPRPDDGTPRHVPDSSASYSLTQLRDRFISPVWHPAEHPPQPEVVAHGRKPDVFACGFCHRADGPGGPENANLMGLPAKYMLQQVAHFKSGACAGCHGAGLTGMGDIPRLAGRSPTYLVRQLYEFKHGFRAGAQSALMKPTVENLALEDMIAVSAYAASLPPAHQDTH